MATDLSTEVPINQFAQFDYVASQINQTFDPLIAELIARRNALLLRLSQLKENYETKEITRKAGKKEIEQQMQQLILRENINIPTYQKATDALKEGMQQLETPTRLPNPIFQCPTLNELKSNIADFGEIREWEVPDYTIKKEPIIAAGKRGSGINELAAASGLAIDEHNQLIYIADYNNKRVQVVSIEGQFRDRFGQDKLEYPWGIALTKEHIFITDVGLDALLIFEKKNYQLVKKTGTKGSKDGEFILPSGLCVDYNGDVVVADTRNNRVSVFSKDLQFISNIGVGQLRKPRDVKMTHNCMIVVLDRSPKCVHFYSKNGHLISSCIPRGESTDCLVTNPLFFCLDLAGNLLISDFSSHAIKIVSQSDQLIHTIGRKGDARGEFKDPYGICITECGTIFAVSENPNYSIQSF